MGHRASSWTNASFAKSCVPRSASNTFHREDDGDDGDDGDDVDDGDDDNDDGDDGYNDVNA